jgi:hypothetical protein
MNNPVNLTDPTGMCAWDLCIGEVAAGFALAATTVVYLNSPAVGDPSRTNGQVIVDSGAEAMQSLGNLLSNATSGPYSGLTDGQLGKAGDSYGELIRQHQKALEDYLADPDAHDNKGLLEKADADTRQKIIDGREKALEKQIKKQEGELEKIREEQKRRDEQKKNEDSEE